MHPQAAAASKLWKVKVPVKVKVFDWLLLLGKLNTMDILQQRRSFQSISPKWCVMQER